MTCLVQRLQLSLVIETNAIAQIDIASLSLNVMLQFCTVTATPRLMMIRNWCVWMRLARSAVSKHGIDKRQVRLFQETLNSKKKKAESIKQMMLYVPR